MADSKPLGLKNGCLNMGDHPQVEQMKIPKNVIQHLYEQMIIGQFISFISSSGLA
jgi:hypothetical protein